MPIVKKKRPEKNTNEKALCSGGAKNPSREKKRVQPELITQTLQQPSKKEQSTDQSSVADALAEMAAAVSSLTKRTETERR